jgi:hypothetical protein
MMARLPEASFISMVDAIFCTVSIIIILMVMIPQNQSRVGHVPQTDLTVSCAMRDPLDYKVQVKSAAAAAPPETHVTTDMDFPAAVIAVRQLINGELARLNRLSARVGVLFTGHDRICVDTVLCALAKGVSECPRSNIEIPERPPGETVPIVTIVFVGESVGDRR